MEILDLIEAAQSGRAIANLGASVGIGEGDARAVVEAVLPQLSVALERNTLSRGGLADVVRALGDGHHEQILERPELWREPRVVADGEAILAHILGSEHKAGVLAARTSRATGIDGGIVEALLPIIAQLLMGAISKYMRGGLGDILSRLPGASDAGGRVPSADPWGSGGPSHETGGTMQDGGQRGGFDLPAPTGGGRPWGRGESAGDGSPPAGGYQLPRYNLPGGGQSTDISRGEPAGQSGGFPLPGPSSSGDNPYGDLSDILRRRGNTPAPTEGGSRGSLWSVVRNILGSALGFGGSGFFGWLVRLAIMRIGWPLLRRMIFGR